MKEPPIPREGWGHPRKSMSPRGFGCGSDRARQSWPVCRVPGVPGRFRRERVNEGAGLVSLARFFLGGKVTALEKRSLTAETANSLEGL